jgi:hypothetical protein
VSVDLDVKLIRPIAIQDVLPKIGTALQETLGLSFLPRIVACEYVEGARRPLRQEMIALEMNSVLFQIENEPEVAYVGTYVIEHPTLASEEQGAYVYINVSSQRSPLEYALAAAAAAGLACELDTLVIDSTPFYTEALSQSAQSFIKRIKVNGRFHDYRAAAEVFYDALPKG